MKIARIICALLAWVTFTTSSANAQACIGVPSIGGTLAPELNWGSGWGVDGGATRVGGAATLNFSGPGTTRVSYANQSGSVITAEAAYELIDASSTFSACPVVRLVRFKQSRLRESYEQGEATFTERRMAAGVAFSASSGIWSIYATPLLDASRQRVQNSGGGVDGYDYTTNWSRAFAIDFGARVSNLKWYAGATIGLGATEYTSLVIGRAFDIGR